MNEVDLKYLNLLEDIINNGSFKQTRSGNVLSVFDRNLSFDLSKGFPLLTTKKMYIRGILNELLWFIKGDTNINYLLNNNVKIWNDDAYRYYNEIVAESNTLEKDESKKIIACDKESFINLCLNKSSIDLNGKNGKYRYTYGDLGDVYGKQWRRYGVSNKDQIHDIIDKLKNSPDDRRMLCLAYNPDVLDSVALPPCHLMFQVYTRPLSKQERFTWLHENSHGKFDEYKTVTNKILDDNNVPTREISLKWTQRSVDTFLGLPFNIASYAFLLHILAHCSNMVVGKLSCSLGDCHIYEAHLDAVKEQLSRKDKAFKLPKININKDIIDIDKLKSDDFNIIGYESCPSIKAPLCVG